MLPSPLAWRPCLTHFSAWRHGNLGPKLIGISCDEAECLGLLLPHCRQVGGLPVFYHLIFRFAPSALSWLHPSYISAFLTATYLFSSISFFAPRLQNKFTSISGHNLSSTTMIFSTPVKPLPPPSPIYFPCFCIHLVHPLQSPLLFIIICVHCLYVSVYFLPRLCCWHFTFLFLLLLLLCCVLIHSVFRSSMSLVSVKNEEKKRRAYPVSGNVSPTSQRASSCS